MNQTDNEEEDDDNILKEVINEADKDNVGMNATPVKEVEAEEDLDESIGQEDENLEEDEQVLEDDNKVVNERVGEMETGPSTTLALKTLPLGITN